MTLSDYFKTHLGLPYLYGGKVPLTGLDCSGLVAWCFHAHGLIQTTDVNAQAIYNLFRATATPLQEPKEGSLIFYGKSADAIDHVAYALNSFMVIEAAGGDASTTSLKEAQRRGACVRLRPFHYRQDLVVIVHPKYNGLNGVSY